VKIDRLARFGVILMAGMAITVPSTARSLGMDTLGGPSPAVHADWPHFHFDAANTGFNPFEDMISTSNVGSLVQKWAVSTAPGASPSPIVYRGLVYVAPADGVVRALDAATGAVAWSYDTGGVTDGDAPTAANGMVFVGNDEGVVSALDAATGGSLWSVRLGTIISHSPTVESGTVYVTVIDGPTSFVDALDASTGDVRWSHGIAAAGTPGLANGLVYETNSFGCYVEALNARVGRSQWIRGGLCEIGAMSSVAATEENVFAEVDGSVQEFDALNGVRDGTRPPSASRTPRRRWPKGCCTGPRPRICSRGTSPPARCCGSCRCQAGPTPLPPWPTAWCTCQRTMGDSAPTRLRPG
jgi:hypothetical protein